MARTFTLLGALLALGCSSDDQSSGSGGRSGTGGGVGVAGGGGAGGTCAIQSSECQTCAQGGVCGVVAADCASDSGCKAARPVLEDCICQGTQKLDDCVASFLNSGGPPANPYFNCFKSACGVPCGIYQ